jgi:hypothetical protein
MHIVKIVETCEANSHSFTHWRNTVELIANDLLLTSAHYTDKYLRMDEHIILGCVCMFAKVMICVLSTCIFNFQ